MNINTEKEYLNARFNRTELKAYAKRTFKSHYVLFVIVCLFAAFIGAEFSTTLSAITWKYCKEELFHAVSGSAPSV